MEKLQTDCHRAALRDRSERDEPPADQLARERCPISDSRSARQIAAASVPHAGAVVLPRAGSPVQNLINHRDETAHTPQQPAADVWCRLVVPGTRA